MPARARDILRSTYQYNLAHDSPDNFIPSILTPTIPPHGLLPPPNRSCNVQMDSRRIRALRPTISQTELDTTLFLNAYARYRSRGGRNDISEFQQDHPNNSPNPANMRPHHSYRAWFARTVIGNSEHHTTDHGFALDQYIAYRRTNRMPPEGLRPSEACTCFDPLCGRSHHRHSNIFMLQDAHSTLHPTKPTNQPSPTILANLDTGAESCTAPAELIRTSKWAPTTHPAPAGTGLRYGSGEITPITHQVTIGTTPVLVTPDHCDTALIGAFPITATGHTIVFTNTYSQIEDTANQYQLTFPKEPSANSWNIPLGTLEQLAHLRTQHPRKYTQSDRSHIDQPTPTPDSNDPIAIADSGAETCTAPLSSINGTPYASKIHNAPPHTAIRYGNSDVVPVEHQTTIGSTTVQLTPNYCAEPLIAISALTRTGHIVILTPTALIITAYNNAYSIRFPKHPTSRRWTLPISTLERLHNLHLTHQPQPPIPSRELHAYSARLHEIDRTTSARVTNLHKRTGHAPEDDMILAITQLWDNTNVTPSDISRVFYREPCLLCVLAKRCRDNHNRWSRHTLKRTRPPTPPTANTTIPTNTSTDSAPPTPVDIAHLIYNPDPPKLPPLLPPTPTDDTQNPNTAQPPTRIGEIISMDNVGPPISPTSIDGYSSLFVFRDIASKTLFTYPIKSPNEDTFLYYLNRVIKYFLDHGFTPRILRTDYFSTFISKASEVYYTNNNLEHQTSAPYQQWQNSVERDVQTLVNNTSAVLHGQDHIRADCWTYAAQHWTSLHNNLPHPVTKRAPLQMLNPNHRVDATHQFRYQFGDILCFPLEKHERTWKFDTRNELGFYLGDKPGTKGGVLIYKPYEHTVVIRANTHRLQVSTMQLLQWYQRRKDVRSAPLQYKQVEDAAIDLLKDCTFDPPLPDISTTDDTAQSDNTAPITPNAPPPTINPHDTAATTNNTTPNTNTNQHSAASLPHRTRHHTSRRHYDPVSDTTIPYYPTVTNNLTSTLPTTTPTIPTTADQNPTPPPPPPPPPILTALFHRTIQGRIHHVRPLLQDQRHHPRRHQRHPYR